MTQSSKTKPPAHVDRRWFLSQCGVGIGSLALHQLLARDALASDVEAGAQGPLAPRLKLL